MAEPLEELRRVRLEKLKKIRELGVDPYPSSFEPRERIDFVRNKVFKETVRVAGRLIGWRSHGKIIFGDLRDESGQIQVLMKKDLFSGEKLELIGLLDIGDFLRVSGKLFQTKAGELTIEVSDYTLLSKSIRPLPSVWYGLKDVEERYRRRYLDLILSDTAKKVLDARWLIEAEIRRFLWGEDFTEVETPVLQSLYGGTNARPFTTHLNALDQDYYLRVAPELYLKRLIIGGYERIFEIARNFRNEGIDHSHFPEFTMLEWYEAYADYGRVMDLAEALLKHLVNKLNGNLKVKVGQDEIDLADKWPRIPIEDLIKDHFQVDWETVSEEKVKKLQTNFKLEVRGNWSKSKALFSLFEHEIAPKLINPTWVIDYPTEVSPLSKAHRNKAGRTERFEGYIGGVEIFDGWSEIVDGLSQRARFENEQKNMKAGDAEAMPLDEEFIEALEYGCPPLGGIGFGIDRLVMFLTNTWAIKEVVSFPILKPEIGSHKS